MLIQQLMQQVRGRSSVIKVVAEVCLLSANIGNSRSFGI